MNAIATLMFQRDSRNDKQRLNHAEDMQRLASQIDGMRARDLTCRLYMYARIVLVEPFIKRSDLKPNHTV